MTLQALLVRRAGASESRTAYLAAAAELGPPCGSVGRSSARPGWSLGARGGSKPLEKGKNWLLLQLRQGISLLTALQAHIYLPASTCSVPTLTQKPILQLPSSSLSPPFKPPDIHLLDLESASANPIPTDHSFSRSDPEIPPRWISARTLATLARTSRRCSPGALDDSRAAQSPPRSSTSVPIPPDHGSPRQYSSFGAQITPFASRTFQYTKEQLGQAEDKVGCAVCALSRSRRG